MLDRFGLGDRLRHKPSELSGGEQQRVAVARALINRPSVLMADEPTGNLDTATSAEIIALLATINRDEGMTLMLVTHDQNVAGACRRTVMMRDGAIVDDGSGA